MLSSPAERNLRRLRNGPREELRTFVGHNSKLCTRVKIQKTVGTLNINLFAFVLHSALRHLQGHGVSGTREKSLCAAAYREAPSFAEVTEWFELDTSVCHVEIVCHSLQV